MTPTISYWEIAWVAVVAFGMVVQMRGIIRSYGREANRQREKLNGSIKLVGRQYLTEGYLRFTAKGLFCIAGLLSWTRPQPRVMPPDLVITYLCLIIGAAMMGIQAAIAQHNEPRIVDKIKEETDK